MVGGDEGELAVGEVLPELVDVGRRAEGWGAFGAGAEAFEVVRGEGEVVGAGLAGDVRAGVAAGEANELARAGVADVDDVEAAAGLGGERDGPLRGLDFGDDRAAGEKVAPGAAAAPARLGGEAGGDLFALGVDGHREAELRGDPHSTVEGQVVGAA